MKKVIVLALMASSAFAQYAAIPSSAYPALDAILNAKLAFTTGSGAPGGSCTYGKDVYTDTVQGNMYWCVATNTWRLHVDISGTQTLTNKTVDGISPAIFAFLSTISSDIQTQVNGKLATSAIPTTSSALKGNGAGGTAAVTGTGSNCVHADGTSAACPGGGATIASTTSALKGDGAGNGAAVTGTGTNCVHVDGTSAACPGGGITTSSQLADFTPSVSSGTLTVQPGMIRFGTMPCTNFTSSATATIATISGGTGVGKLYVSSACALVMQYPSALTVTWTISGMTAQPVVTPTVPSDGWYVGDVQLGASAIASVDDKRGITGMDPTKAGTGIVEDCTLGPCLISADSAVLPFLGGNNTYTGTQDSTGASVTKPSRTVSSDPSGACSQNNEIVLSTASGNPFSCLAGTWHAMGGGGGGGLTGTPTSHYTAVGAGGSALSFVAPSTAGFVMTSNGPSADPSYQAAPGGGGGGSTYVTTGNAEGLSPGVIAQTGMLPALANGACWAFEGMYVLRPNATYSLVLWYGTNPGTTGSSLSSSSIATATGTTPPAAIARGQICNDNGVHNLQNVVFESVGGSIAYASMAATGENSSTWNQDTSATNLKIGLEIATGSNFYKVLSFRVWPVQ
jgi:hypothetical protein